ncbi:hypothetical protein BX600DRAFT_546837 [Xylariales sp. PMI_506]|nr:hypothetical protein BX600DRAFT_546837 [Xylariales sp. PMI_506]
MSAFVGSPPNTKNDYYIVQGFLWNVYLYDADPNLGYSLAITKPHEDYTYSSRKQEITAGLSIVLVAIVLPTLGRLYLRMFLSRLRFGADDLATIVAAIMGIIYTTLQIVMVENGGGMHIWDVTYKEYNIFNYYGVIEETIYYVTVGFIKISLTLFIRRLADRVSKFWIWFCDIFLVTLVAYIILGIFWPLFACNPARSQWDKLYAGQLAAPPTCLDPYPQIEVLNITHIVQGAILLLSPIVILWTVSIGRAKKIRLFVTWACGLIAVLCGLMRQIRADWTSDITWDYTELLAFTSLDVSVGIITISLPVMDAWLAGAWRRAVDRIQVTYRSVVRSGNTTNAEAGSAGVDVTVSAGAAVRHIYGNGSTVRNTVLGSSLVRQYSDSAEEMIKKCPETELNKIVRTDEYNIDYFTPGNELDNEILDQQKTYNKDRVTSFSAY